jgi:hypothetical protein
MYQRQELMEELLESQQGLRLVASMPPESSSAAAARAESAEC